MAKIIDFELFKDNRDISDIEGPCTQCRQVSFCVNTCQRATDWWDQWSAKFNKMNTLHHLKGGQ